MKKKESEEKTEKIKTEKIKYLEAVGRRKAAIARVRILSGKPGLVINEKNLEDYFSLNQQKNKVLEPLKKTGLENKFFVSIKVKGGGGTGQAEAIRLGISRCLIKFDPNLRPILKGFGFLTRDARVVERKKYGLKKARRAPQWQKR